ncbi:MAG: hypothetical protein OES27_08765 [Nitrosopumilus sp.]|nr:hypothetical protein [Nitrosopumilus sp.]
MIDVDQWQKRILQFFVDRSGFGRIYRVTKKDEVLDSFGSHKDTNTYIAWVQLETDGLILHYVSNGDDYYTIDFIDKQNEIAKIIDNDELDSKSKIMQPDESEVDGLEYHFLEKGYRTYPEQSRYYYYTKKDDESYWICLHKTKPNNRASRIILGSLRDQNSRISRIWTATLQASKDAKNDPFLRKRVEDIEPKACGNNRLPSKAAFDVFNYKKWLSKISKGKKTLYKINTIKSKKEISENEDIGEQKQKITDKDSQ